MNIILFILFVTFCTTLEAKKKKHRLRHHKGRHGKNMKNAMEKKFMDLATTYSPSNGRLTASAIQDECTDNAKWCKRYTSYCKISDSVQRLCRKSCNKCRQEEECKDLHPKCHIGIKNNFCNKLASQRKFMEKYCPRSCKFCKIKVLDVSAVSCKDKASKNYCARVNTYGYCSYPSYKQYVKKNCAKTCKFCSNKIHRECGIAKLRTSTEGKKIVGGVDSHKGYYPWQVAIYYLDEFICGGSFVGGKSVVTAAHCFNHRDKNVNKYNVVFGDFNREYPEGTEQKTSVKSLFIHPSYKMTHDDHDIAILTTMEDIKYSSYIANICSPEERETLKPGTKCYVTGWGKTEVSSSSEAILQEVAIPIAQRSTCEKRNAFNFHVVTENMICGGYNDGSTFASACHGDSGGPLQCEVNGKWVLYGVVSWGSPLCNGLDRFTVFTKVSSYKEWISSTINN